MIAGAVLLAATACKKPEVSILVSARPDPEKGDEIPGSNPSKDNLGGPYGRPKAGKEKKDPTPPPPVRLSVSVDDVVLATFLDTLNFDKARDNGELALISCAPPATSPCSVALYIQPEIGMRHRAYNNIPSNGLVVARLINYGDYPDATYHIPAHSRAYWYVDSLGTGLRSRVFRRTPTASERLQWLGTDTVFSECDTRRHRYAGGPAQAKLRKCVDYVASGTRGDAVWGPPNPFVRPVSSKPMAFPQEDALRATELWIKCAQGCCVAGMPN
jgi:hypothetical protein